MQIRPHTINVLVTGFGPYPDGHGGHFDPNTSYVLATYLPRVLDPDTSTNPSPCQINIITLPSPVKSEYGFIRRFCRDLHSTTEQDAQTETGQALDYKSIDLTIHLGEARIWHHITVERMAFKEGFSSAWWGEFERLRYYTILDNIGQNIDDIGDCPWDNVPMGLEGALDVDQVVEGANKLLDTRYRYRTSDSGDSRRGENPSGGSSDLSAQQGPIEIKAHREAGSYCCGFIHYESLANCYVNRKVPRVLFCHVPGEQDEVSLQRAKEGVLSVIVAAANEVLKQRGTA